jgi:hypothetical protein
MYISKYPETDLGIHVNLMGTKFFLSSGVSGQNNKTDNSPPNSAKMWSMTSTTPIYLQGMLLR